MIEKDSKAEQVKDDDNEKRGCEYYLSGCLTAFFYGIFAIVGLGIVISVGAWVISSVFGPVDGPEDYTISALELCSEFENNAITFDSKYAGSAVKVSGRVKQIGVKDDAWKTGDKFYLTFDSCDGLICYFPDNIFFAKQSRAELSKSSKGQWVSVKGKVAKVNDSGVSIKSCTVISQ